MTEEPEVIKTYVNYTSLDELISRKDTVIDSVISFMGSENNNEDSEYYLDYKDHQILIGENNYVLMILINKNKK